MTDLQQRLSSWRSLAASGSTAQEFPGTALAWLKRTTASKCSEASAFCWRTLRPMRLLHRQFWIMLPRGRKTGAQSFSNGSLITQRQSCKRMR
jgi:hypothetical protein